MSVPVKDSGIFSLLPLLFPLRLRAIAMIAIKIRITAAITPTTTKFTPLSSPLSAVSEGSPLSLSVVWVSPVSVASVDSVDASVSGSVVASS